MQKQTKESMYKIKESLKPNETNYIKVGMSTCGIAAGADTVYYILNEEIKKRGLNIQLKKTGCLGMCYAEPMVETKSGDNPAVFYGNLDEESTLKILDKFEHARESELKVSNKYKKIVLRNCGVVDPYSIEDYMSHEGFQALNKALFELGPDGVIEEMKKSGLRGRGGAGFPTWMKWNFTKEVESDKKYVVCNGDEGDPGAYMDRSVLEGDPYTVIEGMIIAGYCTAATKGFCYIRAEYPLAIERIQNAIDECHKHGFLGENILGSGYSFDIEVRIGAGAFVCGEETALLASIEGKRGYPVPRPPFPATKGLWGKPTVINNVETLANITYITYCGGDKFGNIGTDKSKGTKVFALTGKVKNSGLIEVPMGITLREIVEELGEGTSSGKPIKAIQTGGPSGGVIPKEHFDTKVSYEHLQELGSIMGSGGMIVMDEDDSIVDISKFYLGFCVDESCGKCSPCRIGGKQMLKILEKISKKRGTPEDIEKLKLISKAMKNASLCGLGQTAPNPVISSLKYFENEYLECLKK